VATLKDNFGFIETANHDKEIFFHYSEFSGDVDSLELGDMVEYSLSKGKGNKVSAEKVNKTHSVNGITEEADPTIYSGKVIRPLRSVDPTQTEYQGMIEIVEEGTSIPIRLLAICFYFHMTTLNVLKYVGVVAVVF